MFQKTVPDDCSSNAETSFLPLLFSAWPDFHILQNGDWVGQTDSSGMQICWKYAGPAPQIQLNARNSILTCIH